MAGAVDQLAERLARQGQVMSEENDILWWSYSGRSIRTGQVWSAVPDAAVCAVMVARELHERFTIVPSPPVLSRDLIARSLGHRSTTMLTLEDVARAAFRDAGPVGPADRTHALLPVSSAVARMQVVEGARVGSSIESPRYAIAADSDHPSTALDSAAQVIREAEIRSLLGGGHD